MQITVEERDYRALDQYGKPIDSGQSGWLERRFFVLIDGVRYISCLYRYSAERKAKLLEAEYEAYHPRKSISRRHSQAHDEEPEVSE